MVLAQMPPQMPPPQMFQPYPYLQNQPYPGYPSTPPAPKQKAGDSGASAVKINIFDPEVKEDGNQSPPPPQQQAPQFNPYMMPNYEVYSPESVQKPFPSQAYMPIPKAEPPKTQSVVNEIVPPAPVIDSVDQNDYRQGVPPEKKLEEGEVPPQRPADDPRIKELNSQLLSPDLDQQTSAIEKVAKLGQSELPEDQELRNSLTKNPDTYHALEEIITKDNSKLTGDDKDHSEMNKDIAMWTNAILFKDERQMLNTIRNDANKAESSESYTPPTIEEMPNYEAIKANTEDPNPVTRGAAVSALGYLAEPIDKPIVDPIYNKMEKDPDPNVRKAVQDAEKKLDKKIESKQQDSPN